MKVKMIKDQAGAADGITSRLYMKGQEYDLPHKLGEALVGMGAAEEAREKMIRSSPMDKDMRRSPDNKEFPAIDAEVPAPLTSKQVLRMNREDMLQLIRDRELPIPVKEGWKEETIARRIIEALGI
jgi:hypothetical protein